MNTEKETLNALSEQILGAAFKVSNKLGCGFLKKVYENAIVHELRKMGLVAEPQIEIPVFYDSIQVGDYIGDILVERTI